MALINFIVGKKASYVQKTYPYGVYFATDTKEIIFQGISYGMSTSFKAVKSVDISGTTMTIAYTDGTPSTTITLNKSMVGLGNVDNTSDANKPVSTAQQQAINAVKTTVDGYTINGKKISSNPSITKTDLNLGNVTNDAQVKRSEMGVANGVATLDERGKIPVSQLDGQMARVFGIEKAVASSTNLPSSGVSEGDRYYVRDTKKIYERLSSGWDEGTDPKEDTIYNFRLTDATGSTSRTNILYRWDGKDLVEISASIALGETSGTAYEGSKGKQNATDIASLKKKVSAIEGLNIDATYAKKSDALGTNITWAAGTSNGTLTFHTLSGSNKVVTLSLASTAAAGLMSADDKKNLDNLVGDKSIVKKIYFNKTTSLTFPNNNTLNYDLGVENNNVGFLFGSPLIAMSNIYDDPTGDPGHVKVIQVTMLKATSSRNGYMTATQASQLSTLYSKYGSKSYLSISDGGTVTGDVAFNGGFRINNTPLELMGEGIEIYHETPFIDFHYNKSSADYTSRIIETSSGVLKINEVSLSNGQVTATKVNQTSDIRLKENISTIVEDTDKIKDVKFFEFNYISDKNKTKSYGVIAQDLEEVGLKNLVIEDADGYKSVDYNALLILEIQRLRNEIDILKSKIS